MSAKKKFLLFPVFALAALFLGGLVVMLLWNAILPEVTNAGTLSYWQAVGLLLLSRILFGNWRGGKPGGYSGKKQHWRHKAWREKWANMSEQERAQFREQWRKRCGEKRSWGGQETKRNGDEEIL